MQYLTIKQLAERFQIRPEVIRRWARTKKIPALRISRSKRGDWRFPVDQLERWEKQRLTFEVK